MEGKDGVPLRFPRPVMALIATGTAAISIVLAAMPASADQVRPKEWWLTSLGVTGAWSASQGSGVTVAVLSDGVDASQADLAGAVTTAPPHPARPLPPASTSARRAPRSPASSPAAAMALAAIRASSA